MRASPSRRATSMSRRQQLPADAAALPGVRRPAAPTPASSAPRKRSRLRRPSAMISRSPRRRLALDDQRQLAVVVGEADADQALVRGPLVQLHALHVAHADAVLAQRAVERDHQRLVLGPDRSDHERRAVAQLALPRTRSDRAGSRAGRARRRRVAGRCSTTRASSASRPSADASSGLMSISRIRGCSTTRSAEAHQQLRRARPDRPRAPPADAHERRDRCASRSISRRASVVFSGGSAERAIAGTPRPARRRRRTAAPARTADRARCRRSARSPSCDRSSAGP